MESNKNVLDTWVEAQTKSVNNLVESTKKMQESFVKGNLEETTDIYKSWLSNQKGIVEETMKGATAGAADKAADNNTTSNSATDMFSNWMNSQAQLAQTWMENLKKMMPSAQPTSFAPMDMFNEATKMYQQWNGLFSNVLNHTNGQLNGFQNMFSNVSNMNNSFSQMLNSNKVYAQLFEMWQPMAQQMQKNMEAMNSNGSQLKDQMSSLMQAFSPEKYREVMNTVFNFAPADQFKQLYEQMNSFAQRMQSQQHSMQQQWMDQVKQISSIFPENASGMMGGNMFSNPVMKQMEQAFAPLTRLMPAGKEKEAYDSFMQLKDKFAQYWTKYNDMQYIIYTTGQKAMEKVMEDAMAKAKESNGQPVDFKEFYNQWMNTTENLMIDTFGGDEFSKVQGELLTVGSEIKRIMEKQMERTLEGLPLVPRSEADEMAQTIHDLKARVRSLEKMLRDQKTEDTNNAVDNSDKGAKKAIARK